MGAGSERIHNRGHYSADRRPRLTGQEPYTRADTLCGFNELVKANGGNPEELAMRCDVPVGALTDFDMLISWPRICVLMETAAAELDMPSFGLEMALIVPRYFPNVGPLVFMAGVVETIEEWAAIGVQYWRFHTNAYLAQLVDGGEGNEVVFRFRHNPFSQPTRHQTELGLANLCRMAQIVSGFTDMYPTEVRFRHAQPLETRVHTEIFNCPLRFEAEFDEMVLERKILSYPTNGRLTPLKSLINFYVRYRIRKMPLYDQSFRATVEVAIPALIGSGCCNADFVANSFGISGKKLQRLLAQEGTSFTEVFDNVRRGLACRYLDETQIPIRNIAGLLEYSGTPAFIMAFRRWTDSTPSEYRARAY